MSRVILVVEGATEQAVIREVFGPVLAKQGTYVTAALIGRTGHKGGIRAFRKVADDIARLLKQESDTRVGTFFDYYALPSEWPGLEKAHGQRGRQKAITVEAAMREAMTEFMGSDFRRERFIPYIQMHELEALLFADTTRMAEVFEDPGLASKFEVILVDFNHDCELINDQPATAPSKRIASLYPRYRKGKGLNAHAPLILSRIGIERLCHACAHFRDWWGLFPLG